MRSSRPLSAVRKWAPRFVGALLVGIVVFVVHGRLTSQEVAYTPLPVPEKAATQTPSQDRTARTSSSAPTMPYIATSSAKQIYVPNANKELVISSEVSALPTCLPVIDPPRTGANAGGVFSCADFAQPGTNSPSLTIIAGHSSQQVDTAFNRLYSQGDRLVGNEVWIRTATSKDKWLVYTVDAVYHVDKKDLAYAAAIWGYPGQSTKNRLVIVTCLQSGQSGSATKNYVAVAHLTDVR